MSFSRLRRVLFFAAAIIVVFGLGFALGYDYIAGSYVLTGAPLSELPEQGDFSSVANIIAVSEDEDLGIVGYVNVEFVPGDGDILVNIRPFIEPDTQYSAQLALEAAQRYTNVDMTNKDALVTYHISDSVGLVGGPSAGAATAVAMIAAIQNKTVNTSVAMTGTIDPLGNIGYVGGILKKAEAAERQGIDLFLIPAGESAVVLYKKHEKPSRIPFFNNFEYVPEVATIQEYAKEQGWSLEIKEVAMLQQAVEDMLAVP